MNDEEIFQRGITELRKLRVSIKETQPWVDWAELNELSPNLDTLIDNLETAHKETSPCKY